MVAALFVAAALAGCEREPAAKSSPDTVTQARAGQKASVSAARPPAGPDERSRADCLPPHLAEFGEVPLSALLSSFPSPAPVPKGGCAETCNFTWRDGVDYAVIDDFVFEKSLVLGRSKTRPPLGLTDRTDVRGGQAALARQGLTESPIIDDGETLLVVGICGDGLSDLNLHFGGDGRLREVRLRATAF
jgi:hypothetical protein